MQHTHTDNFTIACVLHPQHLGVEAVTNHGTLNMTQPAIVLSPS